MNLLPLCPNCHLTDHHDPTAPLDPDKVALFRAHKDPTILSPQFAPLFARLAFLKGEGRASRLYRQAAELIRFVSVLDMGEFYAEELSSLLLPPASAQFFLASRPANMSETDEKRRDDSAADYVLRVKNSANRVRELAVELLRYQPWRRAEESIRFAG